MNKIYLVSEVKEDGSLENLFTCPDKVHIGIPIGAYFGCAKRYSEVIAPNIKKEYVKVLPYYLVKRIYKSEENSKRFQLRLEYITECYVNPLNGKQLELETKHILLVEELDIL